jgi:hypothetical protein
VENLNRVLEHKLKVEERLSQLQSYYRDRRKANPKHFLKFNSGFQAKETLSSELFQTFIKNKSSEL